MTSLISQADLVEQIKVSWVKKSTIFLEIKMVSCKITEIKCEVNFVYRVTKKTRAINDQAAFYSIAKVEDEQIRRELLTSTTHRYNIATSKYEFDLVEKSHKQVSFLKNGGFDKQEQTEQTLNLTAFESLQKIMQNEANKYAQQLL